jgi:peptide/nickel transport system ATP-binding protein
VSAPVSPLVDVAALGIEARIGGTARTIVRGLDLEVAAGETIGIVGESGSGKSLTALALVGLLPAGVHAHGRVTVRGRNLLDLSERALRRVRGREIALLLQDPFTMLNPLMKIGTQIVETAREQGRGEAIRRLAEVGIADPGVADRYPFQLSGGMQQRAALAAALASDPEVLIADEPSTALDVTTQKEILSLLRRVQEARGMGLVLITHDLRVAFSICRRIYVLYAGSVLEVAPGADLEREPLHPYSLGLLLSEPSVERRFEELSAIDGSVPTPDDVVGRCPFTARCPWAASVCAAGDPPLREVEGGRFSACVRVGRSARSSSRRGAARRSAPTARSRRARTAARRRFSGSTGCARNSPPAGGPARSRSQACRSSSAKARASGSSASRARERRRWRGVSSGSRRRPPAASRSAASTRRTTRVSTQPRAGSCGDSCR